MNQLIWPWFVVSWRVSLFFLWTDNLMKSGALSLQFVNSMPFQALQAIKTKNLLDFWPREALQSFMCACWTRHKNFLWRNCNKLCTVSAEKKSAVATHVGVDFSNKNSKISCERFSWVLIFFIPRMSHKTVALCLGSTVVIFVPSGVS